MSLTSGATSSAASRASGPICAKAQQQASLMGRERIVGESAPMEKNKNGGICMYNMYIYIHKNVYMICICMYMQLCIHVCIYIHMLYLYSLMSIYNNGVL